MTSIFGGSSDHKKSPRRSQVFSPAPGIGLFEPLGSFDMVGLFELVESFDMVGPFEPVGSLVIWKTQNAGMPESRNPRNNYRN